MQGCSQEFSKGGGEVTVCQSEGVHQIVVSFSPPVVGCLLKKSLQKGGLRAPPTPPPPATPLYCLSRNCSRLIGACLLVQPVRVERGYSLRGLKSQENT